jgi:hypothetical protein
MLLLSAAVHFGILPGTYVIFHQYFLWRFPPQIWRFFTAFLLTGPQLGLLFDAYFSYSSLSQLERGRYSKKEDLLWYLTFICGTILVSHRDTRSYNDLCFGTTPQHICPDSALPLQLSRFLELREITPACRIDPHIRKIGQSGV